MLPPFPVDDQTLTLISAALRPGPDVERSSLLDLCQLYSEMAGSDSTEVEECASGVDIIRDAQYHPGDIIEALVAEVLRLRALRSG